MKSSIKNQKAINNPTTKKKIIIVFISKSFIQLFEWINAANEERIPAEGPILSVENCHQCSGYEQIIVYEIAVRGVACAVRHTPADRL